MIGGARAEIEMEVRYGVQRCGRNGTWQNPGEVRRRDIEIESNIITIQHFAITATSGQHDVQQLVDAAATAFEEAVDPERIRRRIADIEGCNLQ